MVASKPVEGDGYVEQIISLFPDSAPILKIRAVQNASGKFHTVIRDGMTGDLFDTGAYHYFTSKEALDVVLIRALDFLRHNCVIWKD